LARRLFTVRKSGARLAWALLILVSTLRAAPMRASSVPLHDGLISYWTLGEGLGVVAHDTAPAGASVDSGQLRNAPSWIDGMFGAGVRFNGSNQDILLPSSVDLNIGADAVTLSAWVKLDLLPANLSGAYAGILDSTSDSYVMYLDKGANELRFKVTTASGAAERPGVPAEMLDTTTWHHVMGTYDGAGRARIYFDGSMVDAHAGAGLTGLVRSGQIGAIGSQPADTGAHAPGSLFKGSIADVALWNRSLGVAEAQYLYNGGLGHAVGAANPSIEPYLPPPPNNRPVIVSAHRGNSFVAPENTLSAFAAAKGFANRVEFDIHVSKDGQLVVMHDSSVDRTTNGVGSVSSLNYAGYIDGLDAGSWFSPAFAGEPVPTMRQSVETIFANGMVPLIERKTGSAAAFVDELTDMGVLDDVVIIAFDWNFLAQVRALAPGVQLGALGSGTLNASVVSDIAAAGANFVNWGDSAGITQATVDMAHAAGLEFHVWTVDSTGRMQQLIDLGVDGITTDDPQTLREIAPWPAPSDFNSDGFVDGSDLELWKAGFGLQTVSGRSDGDADLDGDVDGDDFLAWQRQFSGTSPAGSTAAVPEPAAIALLGVAVAALAQGRRPRSVGPVARFVRRL
jgi:glycerophosphoryl diester phosphodiesterase